MPTSTESTTNEGEITVDPEWWPPNFANLDPVEELRFLRARIAQLEGQQTTNSPTSSAIFDLQKLGLPTLSVTEMNLTKRAMGIRQTMPNLWWCREDLMKMELELKKVKEEMKKTKDLGMNQLNGELIAKMEQYQKQQRQNMGVLTKNKRETKGKAQHVVLGSKLKARYIDELKFVNARYLNNEIYVLRSTQHEQNANKRNFKHDRILL
ncbi:hypothetical protein GPALN_010780 [Globodera pallida]|nr:hypothetical protein GPALN_010780 [Globodera pallida]